MSRLRSFGLFWWDFVVGDDWLVAAAVALGLCGTWLLDHVAGVAAWWLVPLIVLVVLPVSIRRLVRRSS
jgi:F0F1-type ATP synthase assembly protein I